jgi:hypothetical protein
MRGLIQGFNSNGKRDRRFAANGSNLMAARNRPLTELFK